MQKKDILTDIPLHKKARDGAIGPGDQWLAPTEEDFRSSETSNWIFWILFEPGRAHFMQKGYPYGYPFAWKKARDGTRTRGLDLGKVALHQLSHSRISYCLLLFASRQVISYRSQSQKSSTFLIFLYFYFHWSKKCIFPGWIITAYFPFYCIWYTKYGMRGKL